MWRSIGKTSVLVGCVAASSGAYLLLDDIGSSARYVALALLLSLLVFAFVRGGPFLWHRCRLELLLAVATIVGICTSYFWTGAPSEARFALVLLVGLLWTSFMIVALVRLAKTLRGASRSSR